MAGHKPLKIILLEHRPDYRAIYGMNLTLYLAAEVINAKTIAETMTIIGENEIDVIFINNDAYVQDVAFELFNNIINGGLTISLLVRGSTKINDERVKKFDNQTQVRDILQSIAKSASITAKMMSEIDQPLYFPLPMEYIVAGWQTLVNLYIKRKDNYQVAFGSDEIIFAEQLQEYSESEDDFQLYVLRDHRLKFVNSITLQIAAKLNSNISLDERLDATEVAYKMVMEQARQIGVADSTMELAGTCIESMKTIIDTVPTLNSLLGNLMATPSCYRYKQSLLINFIGSHIIKKTKYPSRNQQEILSFVSFFHNIALTKDEYAMIHSDEELEASRMSKKEKQVIHKHAQLAAKLVASAEKKIPYEAGIIIKQHHGSGKGLGLSNLSGNISPLAIIFIFAQEWANIILSYETEENRPDKKKVIEMLHKKYNLPAFNKILPILHTLEL